MSLEQEIKSQFAKIFNQSEWYTFKKVADYYFEEAATLLTKDIRIDVKSELLIRNIKKRLFLGIGLELILKSFYLKNGYFINRLKRNVEVEYEKPLKFSFGIEHKKFDSANSLSLNYLIQEMNKIDDFREHDEILIGFKIIKVFRNKETHVVTPKHEFINNSYKKIQNSIIKFYECAFQEKIKFKISMKPNETGIFKIEKKLA